MKDKIAYFCEQCGQQYAKWVGKCTDCGSWNSVHEVRVHEKKSNRPESASRPVPLSEVTSHVVDRKRSGIAELDIVLGGGLVPASVVLLGGEPGIGKSTLLLQAAQSYACSEYRVLYVTAEESLSQVYLRSKRLGVSDQGVMVVTCTEMEVIQQHIEEVKPSLLIIDSIQTILTGSVDSFAGSVSQIRECGYELTTIAKNRGMSVFLVGHVTKEGSIAGPKVLEHMVDVVLYFEGSSHPSYRLLRTMKNRFGSTHEIGVFEMKEDGLRSVSNPSELFLSERPEHTNGSVVAVTVEGTRPILVEIQALVSQSYLNLPRRTAIGVDPNRVSLLVAILEKRGGFRLYDQDVYVNVAGGLRLSEPAVDLAILSAMLSSLKGKKTSNKTIFFGEIGLGGELRSVPHADIRLKEAEKLGFYNIYLPKRNLKDLKTEEKTKLIGLEHIGELNDLF